jgi:hypothetical protein
MADGSNELLLKSLGVKRKFISTWHHVYIWWQCRIEDKGDILHHIKFCQGTEIWHCSKQLVVCKIPAEDSYSNEIHWKLLTYAYVLSFDREVKIDTALTVHLGQLGCWYWLELLLWIYYCLIGWWRCKEVNINAENMFGIKKNGYILTESGGWWCYQVQQG